MIPLIALATASLVHPLHGALADANGQPIDGTHPVVMRVYAGAVGGTPALTASQSVSFQRGAFATTLPELPASAARGTGDLLLTIEVGGIESAPVTLGATARAGWARHAGGLTTTDPVSVANITATGAFSGVGAVFSSALQATSLALADRIDAATASITGAILAGSANVAGQLRGGTVVADGAISGASATVTGQLRGGSLTADGAITGSNATVTGQLRGGSVTSTGGLSGTTGAFGGNLGAGQLTLGTAPSATNHVVRRDHLESALLGYTPNSALGAYATTASLGALATTASLAAYAPTSSLSSYLPKTGGTLTGNLGGTHASFSGTFGATGAAAAGSLSVGANAAITGALTTGSAVRHGNTFEYHTSGSSSTLSTWEAVFDAPVSAYYEVVVTFAHCGGGCHWSYRRHTFWVNAAEVLIPMENAENNNHDTGYGPNGGAWTISRVTTSAGVAARFRVSKAVGTGGTNDFGGPVHLRISGSQPVTLVSKTN